MTEKDYWKECLACGADECGLTLTPEHLDALAVCVELGHENYGQAFYSPPPSDRISEIEREWENKCKAIQREFDSYRRNAETAVKTALRQHDDASVSIGEYGEVTRWGGRVERIQ